MAPPKFLVEDHEIVLYGVCATCVSSGKPKRTGSGAIKKTSKIR
jgi:hypothetical protein